MEDAAATKEQLAGVSYGVNTFQQIYCSLLSLAMLVELPVLPLKRQREMSDTLFRMERLIGQDGHFLIARTLQTAKSLCLVQTDSLQQSEHCFPAARLLHLIHGLHC